jgi:hypothetical protein
MQISQALCFPSVTSIFQDFVSILNMLGKSRNVAAVQRVNRAWNISARAAHLVLHNIDGGKFAGRSLFVMKV